MKHKTYVLYVFCFGYSVDELLGGGVWTGEVTELVGSVAVGKTQVIKLYLPICHLLFFSLALSDYMPCGGFCTSLGVSSLLHVCLTFLSSISLLMYLMASTLI